MTTTRAVTLRLPEQDFSRLQRQAEQAGVRPGTMARMILRGHLSRVEPDPLATLERLRKIREQIQGDEPMDAVEIVRAGREELDRRSRL